MGVLSKAVTPPWYLQWCWYLEPGENGNAPAIHQKRLPTSATFMWCWNRDVKKSPFKGGDNTFLVPQLLNSNFFWPRWAFNLLFTVVCLTMASRWKPRESVKEAEYFEEIESKFWFILDWRFFGENAWWHLCQHKTPILFVFWLLWLKTTD